jgi:hypothetical protein
LNFSSGYPLQVRRRANSQNLHRAFRFYPAAFEKKTFHQQNKRVTSLRGGGTTTKQSYKKLTSILFFKYFKISYNNMGLLRRSSSQ